MCGALRLGGGGAVNGLLHGGFVAAVHHHALAGEVGAVVQAVAQLGAFVSLQARQLEGAWHEGTYAGGDEHSARQQLGALRGANEEAAAWLGLHGVHLLAQVERGAKGLDLRAQPLHQFVPGAGLNGGNVVDGFVAVQLGALAAGVGQGVDDVGAQAVQAQLEHLEQADRPRTDDDGVSGGGGQEGSGGVHGMGRGCGAAQCRPGRGASREISGPGP